MGLFDIAEEVEEQIKEIIVDQKYSNTYRYECKNDVCLRIQTNLHKKRAPDYAEADLYLRTGKQSHRTAMKKLLGLLVDAGHIHRLLPASARWIRFW